MKRKPRTKPRRQRRWLVPTATTALLLASLSLAGWAASKGAQPADKAKPTPEAPAAPTAGADELPPAKPDTVRITIQTVPPRKAMVRWGGKSLGFIPVPRPLVVERPRDSGPLDLVIRASGYLPVHTRAYTFSDSRVAVKLTTPAEKSKLFGYREEPAPNPDAGVPAEPGPAPAAPMGPMPPAPAPAPAPAPPAN
jgi:hypothetical protein